jgi:branched-chain amino acid transport system ATP-binding protein
MAKFLELQGITAGYGDSVVLEDISFSLDPGDRLALLGRNGMGKTTLLLTLLGLTRVHAGRIAFEGRNWAALSTFQRAHEGLGWVPQERGIFPSLTVEEHLSSVARPGHWDVRRVYQLFPRLLERRANLGNQLSGGEQQMLAIGRALMVNPKLLLLDEPLEGLAPVMVQELLRVLQNLSAEGGMAFVLVEQHARLALSLTKEAIVLDRGRVVHHGKSDRLAADPDLLRRLLALP